ncbi:MAG: hypothetical protein ABI851_16140 [Saprospiraceae bacterium]
MWLQHESWHADLMPKIWQFGYDKNKDLDPFFIDLKTSGKGDYYSDEWEDSNRNNMYPFSKLKDDFYTIFKGTRVGNNYEEDNCHSREKEVYENSIYTSSVSVQ